MSFIYIVPSILKEQIYKKELFGKMVVFNLSILKELGYTDTEIEYMSYRAFVYDVNAVFEGERLREFTKDISGKGLYVNFYLTVEKLHGHCGLMKGSFIDCATACMTAKQGIVQARTNITITNTLTQVVASETITTLNKFAKYENTFTCNTGYNLLDSTAVAKATIGGVEIANAVEIADDGKSCTVYLPVCYDNVVITITAIAD